MASPKKIIGLRVDVDTLRGTRLGVPALVALLAQHDLKATFFFSVGPDNMGRHLWRLFHPSFLLKMLRSKAASLYGWDIILKGTFGPGPLIGQRAAAQIRATAQAGHEIGLHAWDHWRWQQRLDKMDSARLLTDLRQGMKTLTAICGQEIKCAAAPAWMATEAVLASRDQLQLRYGSDCRGQRIYRPKMGGKEYITPQIPTTMPTYDEVIGRHGITPANYNQFLLNKLKPAGLNVLTIHAEAEGLSCHELFGEFLTQAGQEGWRCQPLGELLQNVQDIPCQTMTRNTIPGRQGWLAQQEDRS